MTQSSMFPSPLLLLLSPQHSSGTFRSIKANWGRKKAANFAGSSTVDVDVHSLRAEICGRGEKSILIPVCVCGNGIAPEQPTELK